MPTKYTPTEMMNRESRSNRYYRNAVERHWDPGEIDLERDVERLLEYIEGAENYDEQSWDRTLNGIAKFGAGEDAVTEDLAPLATVLEDIDDQLFLTTQLYEEAKHADFFDRYWREVVWAVEDELGWERSNPRDDKWFNEPYVELFDRNKKAQYRLLEDDTPENRAKAYCHYHLTVEGILAQTGYYGMQTSYGGEFEELPHLPGLVEGFTKIRSDEGRHVGFGMNQLKTLIKSEGVEPTLIENTVNELLPLVQGITEDNRYQPDEDEERVGLQDGELAAYAVDKHTDRMQQITDAAADIPDVDELVRLEGDD
ncbi:ferritin family protein [Natronorubrum daqingense]|uniref:Ribonucleoside-diphosphate reductase n=1 Tax=Natronorubrum daqingense TaxID=588898 RepID=A0A1N7CIY0_9EURY|nr:ribonucleoside-diphosphate reductase [Natronorubrum daqingense]APX96930.1 ribonucleoside-diphosphate reductase [Natronorubrum daqingense]SIR63581.1 ribonucleoside-diphosphate reductase beta chain [Natronorubrum daqingense]